MPNRFTVYDYIDYFGNQGYDREALKRNFQPAVQSLIEDGRVRDTWDKKGKIKIYELIRSPLEDEELFTKRGDSYVENEKLIS